MMQYRNIQEPGPFRDAFEKPTDGVLYQELITHKVKYGMLTKEIVTRTFKADGEYHDTSHHQPLIRINNE